MAAVVAGRPARRGRGPRIGVSLSREALCAAIRRPGESRVQPWRAALAPLNGDGTPWSGLTEALRALARDAGVQDGRLTIALMSPLVEARGVELPPVSDAEAYQLLSRGAGKYFAAARGPQVVGAVPRGRGSDGATRVAAAAPARLLNAINEAAAAAGWTVEAVIPAEAAWGLAAARWSGGRAGHAQLLVAHDDRTDLLRVDGGRLVGLRRFRGGAADAALIAEASSNGSGPLSVVGSPDVRRELSRQLASLGVTVDTPTSAVTEVSEHADLLAAVFAGPDASPQLITDAARAGRAMRIRRMSMYVGAAAAVIALLGGSFELWGAHRELANIRVQTAALAPQLRLTTAGNTTVTTAFNQLKVLATAERTAPHYSSVIAAVSEHLPTDAYLTGFHATLDSVRIDGHAAHASRVIDELVHTPGLSGAQSTSPTRVVKEQDGPPRELFVVGARLVQRGVTTPPPAVAPRGAGGRR